MYPIVRMIEISKSHKKSYEKIDISDENFDITIQFNDTQNLFLEDFTITHYFHFALKKIDDKYECDTVYEIKQCDGVENITVYSHKYKYTFDYVPHSMYYRNNFESLENFLHELHNEELNGMNILFSQVYME